jgi:arylsulfatase A-like enzyme
VKIRLRRAVCRVVSTSSAALASTAVAFLLFAVGTASTDNTVDATDAAARLNVLIIVTDDQRAGLSVMPATRRWFGDRGTYFSNAYVTTPTCCPSRASLLTGRYAHNTGVTNESKATVLNQSTTLNYYLDTAGYHTALFGKYLNTWPLEQPPRNWDEFAYFTNSTSSTYEGRGWNINGTIRDTRSYATDYIGSRAASVISDPAKNPWFLYLSTPNPHGPSVAEPEYERAPVGQWDGNPGVFESDLSDKPPYVQASTTSFSTGSRRRTKQLRSLYSVDDMVQTVFTALRDTGQLRNTIAVFISDNGYLWGEHRRCCKSTPYTQSIRIPMFAYWPDHFTAGAVDRRLVANIDIVPTILAATGVRATTATIDGRSLLSSHRDRLFLEFFRSRSTAPRWFSTRTATYQYVEYADGSGFREYYNLRTDPWQLDNVFNNRVVGDEPPNAARLAAQLAADRQCAGTSCP